MPPIYIKGERLNYKRQPNFLNPIKKGFGDPYGDNIVLLLKGDGANDSTAILDTSPSPKTVSRFGDVKISTAQSKYGGSSIYFDGTGDYLTLGDSNDWVFGSNDFTIEFWFYQTRTTQTNLIDFRANGVNGARILVYTLSSSIMYFVDSSVRLTESFSLNNWKHIALCRSSGTTRLFVDGISNQTFTDTFNYQSSQGPTIGISSNKSSWSLMGFLDSLRITKGVARYSAVFNPETDTYLAY